MGKRRKQPPIVLPYMDIAMAVGRMTDDQLVAVTSYVDPPQRDLRWRYRCAVAEQERRRRGCKGCGKPVERGYWCCDSCFYAEDLWIGTPEQNENEEDDDGVPDAA